MFNHASFDFMFVVSTGITLLRCDMQRNMERGERQHTSL
jgi:hypothetical protein